MDPTSKLLLQHYQRHQRTDSIDGLADLSLNIMFLRNTMSKGVIRLVEMDNVPWLHLDRWAVAESSKKAADELFLQLGSRVFFPFVEPMKSRNKAPRRGWSEFVCEIVSFARKARELAEIWHEGGGCSVEHISKAIRRIPGFGGKGFRMKA